MPSQLKIDIRFPGRPELLCIGAHCDDIEIGCCGTLLRLYESHPNIRIVWLILSSNPEREAESRNSVRRLFGNDSDVHLVFHQFRDGYLPYTGGLVKDAFESIKAQANPDVILSHWSGDRHQDHRFVSELTWSTFRSSLILEYEIPKYDGDLGQPNVFVPISEALLDKKIDNLLNCYRSQRQKLWFDAETFKSLHRLRGIESSSDSRYAEAFYCRKLTLL